MCVSLSSTSIIAPGPTPFLEQIHPSMPRGSYHTAGNQLIGCFYEGVTLTIADPMSPGRGDGVFSIDKKGLFGQFFF